MASFEATDAALTAVEADAAITFAIKGDDGPSCAAAAGAVAAAAGLNLATELRAVHFDGELGQVAMIPTRGAVPAAVLLVAGLGERDGLTMEAVRRAAGAAVRAAQKDASAALAAPVDLLGEDVDAGSVVQAVTEGAALGSYAFTAYRRKHHDTPSLEQVRVSAGGVPAEVRDRAMRAGDALARAVNLARDLVNTPPCDKRPPALAERVEDIARQRRLKVKVWDAKALAKGGFGGILGVGQGSSVEPRLVELLYEPSGAARDVVLVGKGITFDTGGLSLKPTSAMSTMKSDMGGAAAIVGAMSLLPELGVKVKVTGLLALAENMPGGDAIRVSDVLTHRGGRTVEVMNTDAEGRLVLADALAYGAERKPDAMIDLATLTGAQIVALGPSIAGLMGSDDDLVKALRAAADAAGEQVWHLPLPAEYAEHLKSEVADLKNIGRQGQAGALIAGLFLKEFTAGVPWAHLDIAGPAYSEEGDRFYTHKGGTGMGVRTLVRYLEDCVA